MNDTVTLSDHAIVRIIDLLQLALLTGTDIIDKLTISETENQAFTDAVKRLQVRAEELGAEGVRNVDVN